MRIVLLGPSPVVGVDIRILTGSNGFAVDKQRQPLPNPIIGSRRNDIRVLKVNETGGDSCQ